MDLSRHDNLGVEDLTAVAGGLKNIAKNVREKAQLKKAKQMIKDGKANQLPSNYVTLLIRNGVDTALYSNAPAYLARPEVIAAKSAALSKSEITGTPEEATNAAEKEAVEAHQSANLKKMLPYIVGIVVIIILLYFFVKR
jgi:hypothetical protein